MGVYRDVNSAWSRTCWHRLAIAPIAAEHVLKSFARPRRDMGVQHWSLKVIDSRAPTGKVGTVSIEGLGWGEVDFLNDIEAATKLTDGWV